MNITENVSPQNIRGQFTIGAVPFDTEAGLGVSWGNGIINMNEDYAKSDFIAIMNPLTFLALATPPKQFKSVGFIQSHLKSGQAIAPPFLEGTLNFWGKKRLKIVGHEGRNRAKTCHLAQPNMPVPVFFRLDKTITTDAFAQLSQGAVRQSTKDHYIAGPLFKCFFHAGQRYSVTQTHNKKGGIDTTAVETPYSRDINVPV